MAAMRQAALWTAAQATTYVARQKRRTRVWRAVDHMDRGLLFIIGDFFNTFGGAAAAARAVERGRKPHRRGREPASIRRL
jgi:hypothetical protein